MSADPAETKVDRQGPPSDRVRIRRMASRAAYERSAVDAIFDEALVAHLAFVHEGQPYAIPTLQARVGDIVYFHGSAGSRTIRALAAGLPACLTVTLIDGLVLARSAVHQSVNYRSAMLLGSARLVEQESELRLALEQFTERLVPGRWAEVRPPTDKECKRVSVLAMSLEECSAKIRSGPPLDDPEDLGLEVWAGVVPLRLAAGVPDPAPDLAQHLAPSPALERWVQRRP